MIISGSNNARRDVTINIKKDIKIVIFFLLEMKNEIAWKTLD